MAARLPMRWSLMLWTQFAYWGALFVAIWAYVALPHGRNTGFLLLPIVPGLLVFAAAYLLYCGSDEHFRLRIPQATARTAVIIATLAMIYASMELAVLAKLSAVWVHLVGWCLFDIQIAYLWSHFDRDEEYPSRAAR
jgi:hypothetical protein